MVAIESHSARTGETRRLAAASEPQRKATDENWHSIPFSPAGANAGHRFAMFAPRSAGYLPNHTAEREKVTPLACASSRT